MAWETEFADDALRDLELVFDHLLGAYSAFGETHGAAFDHAERRTEDILRVARTIAAAPYRGTLREDLAPGLRCVTINRAIYWFDLDEDRRTVRILAIFFGGQDHERHMLIRLLGPKPQ